MSDREFDLGVLLHGLRLRGESYAAGVIENLTADVACREEDLETACLRFERAEARVSEALAVMDRSMYGDPEVPFRMRAALEGTGHE